jgi:adenylate cyclase
MTATGLVCGSCGTELSAKVKFCSECGPTAVSGAAEYEQEWLREIIAQLAERSASVVLRYGGAMDKFTGNGIMALFGAPNVLEDNAFRAWLGELDLQAETAELVREIEGSDGIGLRLRLSLNSDQIASEIGSGAAGYAAVGQQGDGAADGVCRSAAWGKLTESIAPPGEDAAVQGERQMVRIKWAPRVRCRRGGC